MIASFEDRQTAFAVNCVVALMLLFDTRRKESLPVKTATIFGLVFCVLGFALATQGQAAEYYSYRGPDGRLVISNRPPPPRSLVLRKLELPESADPQVQQPHEGGDTQLNGHYQHPAKPSKNK